MHGKRFGYYLPFLFVCYFNCFLCFFLLPSLLIIYSLCFFKLGDSVKLNHPVDKITREGGKITVHSNGSTFIAKHVVVALPPVLYPSPLISSSPLPSLSPLSLLSSSFLFPIPPRHLLLITHCFITDLM